ASGPDALRILDSHDGTVHLLLTDVVMPHMSGWDLATEVERRIPDIKILFMSGYADDPATGRTRKRSVTLMSKPFTPNILADKVRQALDGDQPRGTTAK